MSIFDLHNKVALITGAAGGLGRQIAITYAEQGAAVILSDINEKGCQSTASDISAMGGNCLCLPANLAEKIEVMQLAKQAVEWMGRIDSLVCCAGMEGYVGSLLNLKDAEWDVLMDVNLRSALWLSQSITPNMRENGGGNVTFVASIAGLRGNKAIGLYGIAKAGLSQLARNLAVELGPENIRVNCIAPGLIETPLSVHVMNNDAFMQRRLSLTPLRRVGQPHEIAGIVAMLASSAGGFITGQTIVADGGTIISDGN